MSTSANRRFEKTFKNLFQSTAFVTICILGLIILFLLKEGLGFVGSYTESLREYRSSGLEYVDLMENKYRDSIELQNELTQIRADWIKRLQDDRQDQRVIQQTIGDSEFSALFAELRETTLPLGAYLKEKRDYVMHARNDSEEAIFDQAYLEGLQSDRERYDSIISQLAEAQIALTRELAVFQTGQKGLDRRLQKAEATALAYSGGVIHHLESLSAWKADASISEFRALISFFTGRHWITASDQQDWYGLLPLLTGSILISAIAMTIAIPTAIGAAIYINQFASKAERTLVKPYIEFISALPSVVIGFFGVMLFGEWMRTFSNMDAFAWLPFFPIEERLNAFTAGALLALMAIPTIFTLTEDALENVSNSLKEASHAVGATKLQTTFRIILPTAISGVISAVMLGFGRVIGETMVVLLCAGNRIKIPEIDLGGEFLFEPVHSMTGIIAQEMGEVVYGGLHYRALFMVGIVLFLVSLAVNYGAQVFAKKFTPKMR
ncbi:MAG: phosphate ABC transporter permease subunit PstC [Opitutales bacterium]